MAKSYLIDTSAAIKYLNESLTTAGLEYIDAIIDEDCSISFISEIELQAWNPVNEDDLAIFQLFTANSNIIGIDTEIIKETIRIRKSYRLKLPDALIAATAVCRNLTLLADNDKDFKKVSELKYINPDKKDV
ncbi:MAG: type II toxin-antitoxin system VapC family toxin [Mucilaginibacter sp.]